MTTPSVGSVGWLDLTVPDAEKLRDFYAAAVGWKIEAVPMGEYADYCLNDVGTNEARAGVCHTRGVNAKMPPVWIPYFVVANLDASLKECQTRGGVLIDGPRNMGTASRFALIRDPAGAYCAFWQSAR